MIKYRTNILKELKDIGYSTYRLRRENLLNVSVQNSLRKGKYLSFDNLSKVCALLQCQPGDILTYVDDEEVHND